MSDINIDLSFESVNLTLGFIDVATLNEANAYTDKKVIDTGGETPETIKEKYESNQSVIDSMARLENTSGTNTGDQDLSSYLLIANLPTSLPASDVFAWAKEATKPTYTASEVGALADTYKGAYDSEVVASPTTGNLTLKLATETVLETALTDANVFTVVLPTPTTRVNESILIFKVGATLPAITLPVGITFPKPLVYEANKTHTIAFEQVTFNGTDYEIFGSYEIR